MRLLVIIAIYRLSDMTFRHSQLMPLMLLIFAVIMTACGATEAATNSFAATLPPTQGAVAVSTVATPTRIPTDTLTPSITPSPTLTPTTTPSPTLTQMPTQTLTPSITPTLAPFAFYRMSRPIAGSGIDYVDRTYPYGSTAQGNWPVHHGVEFQNPKGTPVLATGEGTVYYAGTDAERQFGPRLDYYGNLVIIEHAFASPEGQPVYSLYAHLDRIDVETGQLISQGDRVGSVGASGIAIGSHLHFEVRVDDPESFGATRNPELWLRPYPTFGLLVGRVIDSDGNPLPDVVVQLKRADRQMVFRYGYSYSSDGQVNSDDLWGETFTIGDLPADDYDVVVSTRYGTVLFEQQVTVERDEISWIEIVLD